MKRLTITAVLSLATLPSVARAHHGVAAVGAAGFEGPGAAIETTSALPLPQSLGLILVKSELVSFQHRAVAEPENKTYSSFNMAVLGFGLRPWLSAYLFQPVNLKEQDGAGRNVGLGDINLMLTLGFKYDEGLRLIPEKESLDELGDWHFSFSVACTAPTGATEHTDSRGQPFAPDLQTGFGAPSPAVGMAALKMLSANLTWLADANYQYFLPHSYSYARYRFGSESRLNTALAFRFLARQRLRVDAVAELNGLHIQRDRERDDSGQMVPLSASGGSILYAGLGMRIYWGSLSLALGIRRPALKRLNEGAEQQGAEGLENLRAAVAVSYSRRF